MSPAPAERAARPDGSPALEPPHGWSRSARIFFGFWWFFLPTLLDELLARLPLADPRADRARARGPARLLHYLQHLGGSFVKFGQLLSMRYDLLPERYCRELEKLYDRVPPFPVAEARRIIAQELGAPVDALFRSFDEQPVAAASFGQVHLVTLGRGPDAGSRVVVKVQRPGAEHDYKSDARWLLFLGRLVDATSVMGLVKLTPVFRDFLRWTRRELDFTQEAKNADRVYEETEWNLKQRIPWIDWDHTTRRVLTMEYLDGIPVTEVIRRFEQGDGSIDDELEALGCDRQAIAATVLHNHHLQAFVGEIFHADPHPGNVIVMRDNVVGYVDFGLTGRMTPEGFRELMALMDAVVSRDIERLFLAVLDLLDAPRGLLVTDHYEVFYDAVDRWLDASDNPGATPLEKSITNLVVASMDTARRIGLPLSMNTILYFKALMSVDASVLRLCPDQDYHGELQHTLRLLRLRLIERRFEPGPAMDRSLGSTLFLLGLPEFVKEQVIQYQQTTQTMYRRFNRAPLVLAGLVRWVGGLALLAGLLLLPFDRGWSGHLPIFLTEGAHLDSLRAVAGWWAAVLALGVGCFWMARVLASRSLVKVQGEEG